MAMKGLRPLGLSPALQRQRQIDVTPRRHKREQPRVVVEVECVDMAFELRGVGRGLRFDDGHFVARSLQGIAYLLHHFRTCIALNVNRNARDIEDGASTPAHSMLQTFRAAANGDGIRVGARRRRQLLVIQSYRAAADQQHETENDTYWNYPTCTRGHGRIPPFVLTACVQISEANVKKRVTIDGKASQPR